MGASINTTVVTPAGSYDLVTAATVKALLGITDTSADAILAVLIPQCSAGVQNFCNRVFPVETVKDVIRIDRDAYPWQVPGGVSPLQLSRWPVVSVSSVVEGVGDSAKTLTADDDYEVNATTGQIVRLNADGYPMKWPATKVVVQYSAGYAAIPADVQDATARLVVGRYYERARDPFLKSVAVDGVDTRTYWIPDGDTGAFPPEVADLLDNYRVPVIA